MYIFFWIIILSSATHANETGNYSQIYKQAMSFWFRSIMIIGILLFDYNFLGKYYKALYIISIVLLAIVLIPGIGE